MVESEPIRIKVTETPEATGAYNWLKIRGKEMFAKSGLVREGKVLCSDMDLVRRLFKEAAAELNPSVWGQYWEHVILAPALGRRIAEASKNKLKIDPNSIELALWFHDLGIMVTPQYNRKDKVGDRLLQEIGVSKLIELLSSTHKLMAAAEGLGLTKEQISLKADLTPEQMAKVEKYFQGLTPAQRITNLADNMGKIDENGGLFTMAAFKKYLATQETRYDQTSKWPSVDWAIRSEDGKFPRRPLGAVLQYFTIKRTIEWLNDQGVKFEEICQSLTNYGPRFVALIRHGEVDNPTGKVYTRDYLMATEDIPHLNNQGQQQMQEAANLLSKRKFRVTKIYKSPEARAQESAECIAKILGIQEIRESYLLDDAFAPGPYLKGTRMETFLEGGGNVWDPRWAEYHHETPEAIKRRMQGIFRQATSGLKAGETGVLVSHGDPIAFLLRDLEEKTVGPENIDQNQASYPKKGEAKMVVIDPEGLLFAIYSLNGPQLMKA